MKDWTYDITSKAPKPKWYEFRKKASNLFLWIAKKIYPENPEIKAFFAKIATDAMIYGAAYTIVDPAKVCKIHDDNYKEFYEETKNHNEKS